MVFVVLAIVHCQKKMKTAKRERERERETEIVGERGELNGMTKRSTQCLKQGKNLLYF